MKIFISWSGNYSHEIAKLVNDWLPCVIQGISTFLSSSDIDAGAAWNDVIRGALHDCDFGIIFITQENVQKPWILFEAGALAKNVSESRVVPIFIDVDENEFALSGSPLINLNRIKFDKAGLKKLLMTINNRLETGRLNPSTLNRVFDKWWAELDRDYKKIDKPKAPKGSKDLSKDDRLARIEDTLGSLVSRISQTSPSRSYVRSSRRPSSDQIFREIRNGDMSEIQFVVRIATIDNLKLLRNIEKKLLEYDDEIINKSYLPILSLRLNEIMDS